MLPAFSFFSPKSLHINLQNLILQRGNKFFLSISTLIIRYILTPFSLPGKHFTILNTGLDLSFQLQNYWTNIHWVLFVQHCVERFRRNLQCSWANKITFIKRVWYIINVKFQGKEAITVVINSLRSSYGRSKT